MRPIYVLLSCAFLGVSGCAPAWVNNDLFAGYDFSYVVGRGEGTDIPSARVNAENDARSRVQLSKALSIAVTRNDSSFIAEFVEETRESSTLVNVLDSTSSLMRDVTGADAVRDLMNRRIVTTAEERGVDSISVLTREQRSSLSVITRGDTVPPVGWRMYGGKERTEQISGGYRVSVVYQFQPEEVRPGKWLVNRTPEEFPGVKNPPTRGSFLARNLILPGWGQIVMGKPGRGAVFGVTYLASWAGWAVVRQIRDKDVIALNNSQNAIEQADLIQRVNRFGDYKNGLLGLAAGTLIVSIVDALTGQPDLFEFSPVGGGMSFGLKLPR